MNEKLTFLSFASNDCADEDLRVKFHIESLTTKQNGEQHRVIFGTCRHQKRDLNFPNIHDYQ